MFFLSLAAYLTCLAAAPYWLDSSEFAVAAFSLGVAHPPGHPLAALVGKCFTLLPLGSVAFRVGLGSAVLGAIAAALVALLAIEVARRTGEALGRRDSLVENVVGAGAGLAFGWGHAAALQAVRPEVYALNAALLLAAALALLRFDRTGDRRYLHAASLTVGVALANHHFLAILFSLGALPFFALRPALITSPSPSHRQQGLPSTWRTLGWMVLAGLLGLALYVYLPLRALRHPEVNWGSPSSPARFFWTVSARAFQKSLGHADHAGGFVLALAAVAGELGALAPLTLLGAYVLLRTRPLRPIALLLLGPASLGAIAPALVGFDPENPDAYGYLEPAIALFFAVAATAPAALAALLPRWRRLSVLVAAASSLLAVSLAAINLPSLSLARFADTDRYAGALIDEVPPRGVLVSSYFQTVFALWYLRGVEGRRPDVDHVHRHFLAYPGYRDEVLARRPTLQPIVGPREMIPAGDPSRALLFEYDLDLAPALVADLVPAGLGVLRPDAAAPRAVGEEEEGPAALRRAAIFGSLDEHEPQTRRLLLWLDYLDASRSCSRGHRATAAQAIARARARLAPSLDVDLEALARRCGR